MAYQGTTAASTLANPPIKWGQGVFSNSGTGRADRNSIWMYNSTHLNTEADADGFITDGQALGMSVGDVCFVIGSTTYAVSVHGVRAVSSTGASLSVATIVSSAS